VRIDPDQAAMTAVQVDQPVSGDRQVQLHDDGILAVPPDCSWSDGAAAGVRRARPREPLRPLAYSACVRFGLDIAQQRMSWDELVSRVQFAQDLGFDGAWGFDHFQPMYGSGPGETFEGMTTLAALAGVTDRIRLGLLVTGVTYRHPSVLAAQALTIDHASHGRLELALGAAWFDKEHRELGIPFPSTGTRFDLLEDTLEIVERLFTGEVVDYQGRVVSLEGASLRPRPVQRPHPPIWIGGSGPKRTLPLVARYADVWHSWGTPNSLRDANQRLDGLISEAGRDPSDVMRASSLSLDDLETARRHAAKWQGAGYGYLVCGWPDAGRARVEQFAREVLSALAG
jgi:F420-dependent oxidoreductase-like protein